MDMQVIDALTYSSYKYNRDLGMTHEELISLGVGNEEMRAFYELTK